MTGVGADRYIFLATALAGRREKRVAVAIAVVALALFAAIVPFVRVPLARMPAFIPSYEAALFFIDLITAALLFDQFVRLRFTAVLVLAAGYLFDALIIVSHALSFPGAFAPTGLLGAKEQTTAWLYVFWHGGFPLFVIGYALLRQREGLGGPPHMVVRTGWAIALAVAGTAALAVLFTLLATWGHDSLPLVMQGSDYSMLVRKGISPAVWVLTLLAMATLWQREMRTVDLWLMLVMWIWLFDIGLSAVIGSTRFDLGFYAGRIFGLIAASFLLVTLIIEMARLYADALSAASSSERQLAELERQRQRGDARPKAGDDAASFVHRQNIARYRQLLASPALIGAQRQAIEKLLAEEEKKIRPGEEQG